MSLMAERYFPITFFRLSKCCNKGLTQEQLAEKCGTTKSNSSKIENNVREARISTLQKIVERGFNGHLQISLKF